MALTVAMKEERREVCTYSRSCHGGQRAGHDGRFPPPEDVDHRRHRPGHGSSQLLPVFQMSQIIGGSSAGSEVGFNPPEQQTMAMAGTSWLAKLHPLGTEKKEGHANFAVTLLHRKTYSKYSILKREVTSEAPIGFWVPFNRSISMNPSPS